MANLVTTEERRKIAADLRAGMTRNAVAKKHRRGAATVTRIAQAEGIELDQSATKKAVQAKRDYALAERLILLNEGFDKARELLPTITEAREMQAWMVAVATGIDKRRLEDGEATERGDYTHREAGEKDLEEFFGELDAATAGNGEVGAEQPIHPAPPDEETA